MFRFAACNETFGAEPFARACCKLRAIGYEGIEIAPFTLSETPESLPDTRRTELRRILIDEGLTFAGLHWLLASPPGLHVTTEDDRIRARSWDTLRRLIDLCGDLAGDQPSVMVFGSPRQRDLTTVSARNATERFVNGLREIAPAAGAREVSILIEALPSAQCNFIRTLAEAADVVQSVAHPAVAMIFDSHNTADETESTERLIHRYASQIRHVHVNEMDGRYPGTGNYDFSAMFRALEDVSYTGWISVEVFDFEPDPETVARESLRFLQSQI